MPFFHHVFSSNDLILFVPMALAGALCLGELPIASRAGVRVMNLCGAVFGALLAMVLVETLPTMI